LTGQGRVYPDDVYGPNAVRYYGTGEEALDRQSFALSQRFKGKPNATVTVYRAVPDELVPSARIARLEREKAYILKHGKVPPGAQTRLSRADYYDRITTELEQLKTSATAVKAPDITAGDWVTINRAYAKQHGDNTLRGEYAILSTKVRAKDLFTNGDSIHEWGYVPQPPAVAALKRKWSP